MKKILMALLLSHSISNLSAQDPAVTIDIADLDPDQGEMLRMYGIDYESGDTGSSGLPIGGGGDFDGDGNEDMAIGFMKAQRNGLFRSGVSAVLLGDGTISNTYNANQPDPNIFIIEGSEVRGNLGNELWFADFNNDGFSDLVICCQNCSPPGRDNTGSLVIILGGPHIREFTSEMNPLDLASPDPRIPIIEIFGVEDYDRLGQWMRPADFDGDGVDDIAVGADQSDINRPNDGEVWVIRGGDHVTTATTQIDLADHGSGPWDGNIARFIPPDLPAQSRGLHFGATLFGGDADGNGKAELAVAAALNRSGAGLTPEGVPFGSYHSSGGAAGGGSAVIIWDDHFPEAPWPSGYTVDLETTTGTLTVINGAANLASPFGRSTTFGEELAIGIDFDGDGKGDFLAADLVGDTTGINRNSGLGVVFFEIEQYKNMSIDLDNPSEIPDGARTSVIQGPSQGAIGVDTMAVGDFDNDGLDDLVIGNPQDNPNGRTNAGTLHVFYGNENGWPSFIDTRPGNLPSPDDIRILLLQGGQPFDVLIYSSSFGDVDGDGFTDIITNEMTGNNEIDNLANVGNLVVFSGQMLSESFLQPDPVTDIWMFQ